MNHVTLQGAEATLEGDFPKVGDVAPDFTLVDRDLNNVTLGTFGDSRKLLSIVPSLDTPVCATSSAKFNEATRDLPAKSVVIVVSADLPFAMTRYCTDNQADALVTLSMMRSREFARDYGVLIEDGALAGITARAVLVLDSANTIVHAELVPEISDEPNHEAAIQALRGD